MGMGIAFATVLVLIVLFPAFWLLGWLHDYMTGGPQHAKVEGPIDRRLIT